MPVAVDVMVVCDTMCPWGWVGKRNLEQAIRQVSPDIEVTVGWSPYVLRPDMPPDGQKKGEPHPNCDLCVMRRKAGDKVGIQFAGMGGPLPECDRFQNSRKALTLVSYTLQSSGKAKQDEMMEVLFRKYFTDGLYPDESNLRDAATEVGLDVDEAMAYVMDDANQEAVRNEGLSWREKGVKSIPCFIIDGQRTGLEGACSPEAFVAAIQNAASSSTSPINPVNRKRGCL